MPLSGLIEAMDPPAPKEVRDAARALRYRDFLPSPSCSRPNGLSRQLDLCPLRQGAGRARAELRLLVTRSRQKGADLPRPRKLRVRGRRALVNGRRGTRRVRDRGAREPRSRPPGRCRAGLRSEGFQGLSRLRRGTGPDCRPFATGSRPRRQMSTRSGATGCTATTTRTTRCSPPC